jgi:hypothetical protein
MTGHRPSTGETLCPGLFLFETENRARRYPLIQTLVNLPFLTKVFLDLSFNRRPTFTTSQLEFLVANQPCITPM